ncbi:hemicentin-2-like [Penaeus indicus]|uniref:hemicentin-2-like n=1 Tax=Penaeus indicus TaxID=29960 RepID=UPI00300C2682
MAPSTGVSASSFLFIALLHLIRSQDDDVWSVTGVSGRSSDLPCYFTPRIPGDRPKLILWYKESMKSPLFSHDNTRAPEEQTEQHQEGGGVLTVTLGSATLTYQNVTPQHAGMYECRVDFYQSPAHTNLVNFSVVELPTSVQIIDRQTGHPRNGILGPYYPGQNIMLTCISLNGSPLPNITWWKDNRVISNVWEVTGPAKVQSDLTIDNVTREWHNQTLSCTATNTHLAIPVSVTVLIQMYLLPLSVVISTPGAAREGQQTRLTCTVHGSRPPPIITWTLRGITKRAELKEKNHGLVSISELLVNVTRADDTTRVKCTAENPAVPGSVLSNYTTLTVHYPPSVTASLGRSLKPDLLKEGDDVYFTCSVAANPPASTITWYHEGTVQVQNVSQGVIVSGESLVLQKVRRDKAGKYKCGASNALATVTSAPVHLKIRYKPECQTSPTTYFIYDKPINVTCTVSAHPPVQTITWQWNSSEEVVAIQQVRAGRLEQITAQLTVHPVESKEDRILSCWAVNVMGKQEHACGFSIKVAEMPLPLSSCRLANITASSLSLTCQRPHVTTTGTTLYRAEVYFENRTLFANVTSNRPSFNVSRLDAGTSYQIKVYVTHGPVTSPPVVVSAYTSRSSRTPANSSP